MNPVRWSIFLASLIVATLSFAEKQEWLPILPEDLQIKESPNDPGAPAIELYRAHLIDDPSRSQFIYHRIKILTAKGKKYANVEIPLASESSIHDLKARTIHPDGTIVEFTGKPFEKTIIKGAGIKVLAKTFTLPDVAVGSIIEYRYKVDYGRFSFPKIWVLQGNLYTVKQVFEFKPVAANVRIAWVLRHTSEKPQRTHGNQADLEMHNVPAFPTEEYMPPEESYKPSVQFFYLRSDISSSDRYWEVVGRELSAVTERFIGDHREAKDAAAAAIGNETDPEKKLRRIYARAQEVRNLSYDRQETAEERKKEDIKSNEDVGEVLRRGYGTRWDINLVFVAMARAAGFDVLVVMASERQNDFFNKEALSLEQLDSPMAVVKLNGNEVYLDPGTIYCPYGLLPWMHTAVTAMKLDKKGGAFVSMPSAPQDKAVIKRNITAALDENGSLKGEVTITFQDTEALDLRLSAVHTDDVGKAKALEDELERWLPQDAVVKLKEVRGWETSEAPLVATFSLEIPGYASTAGKRLLMPAYLFRTRRRDAFNYADRKYPVYFPYAFSELDVIQIKLPAGFAIEGAPAQHDVRLPYARYEDIVQFASGLLVTKRVLLLNRFFFPLNEYPEMKDFFSQVIAGDEQQAVLQSANPNQARENN